jgi:hypothetical protein
VLRRGVSVGYGKVFIGTVDGPSSRSTPRAARWSGDIALTTETRPSEATSQLKDEKALHGMTTAGITGVGVKPVTTPASSRFAQVPQSMVGALHGQRLP